MTENYPSESVVGLSIDDRLHRTEAAQLKLANQRSFRKQDEGDWQERALCAQTDPEAFFPEQGGSSRAAKAVCRACEVRVECLEDDLEKGISWGVRGGLSESERRKIKKRAV